MQSGYTSKIKLDTETGQQCLHVFYDAELDNYDDAINAALAYHGIKKGEMVVIALPRRIPGGIPDFDV